MKEDIVAGIKNAIERGYSLEQAKTSFINAGYNVRDVEEAASSLTGVITELPQIQQIPEQIQQVPKIKQEVRQQVMQEGVIKKPGSKKIIMNIIIIILVIILLFALTVLAGLLLAPEKTKEILSSIFPLLGE